MSFSDHFLQLQQLNYILNIILLYSPKFTKDLKQSQDNPVHRATGCKLNCPDSITHSARFFSSFQHPEPTKLPIQQLWGLLHRGRGVLKLTTYLQTLPRSRTLELHLHSPTCPYGIVLNYFGNGATFTFIIYLTPSRVTSTAT